MVRQRSRSATREFSGLPMMQRVAHPNRNPTTVDANSRPGERLQSPKRISRCNLRALLAVETGMQLIVRGLLVGLAMLVASLFVVAGVSSLLESRADQNVYIGER
jgi:hypothetical protein